MRSKKFSMGCISIEKTLLGLLTALLLLSGACSSTVERSFPRSSLFNGSSSSLRVSPESIDGAKTHEIFFHLTEKVPCLEVETSATYYPHPFAKKKKIARTFFIIEKRIDTTPFIGKKRVLYSPMGKNFDQRWRRWQTITLCTSRERPLLHFDSDSTYRMRITTFQAREVDFTITIRGEAPVEFHRDPPSL